MKMLKIYLKQKMARICKKSSRKNMKEIMPVWQHLVAKYLKENWIYKNINKGQEMFDQFLQEIR